MYPSRLTSYSREAYSMEFGERFCGAPDRGGQRCHGGLPVVVFEESDMIRLHRPCPSEASSQVGRAIFSVRSAEERTRIVRSVFQIIGFSSFTCIVFQTDGADITKAYMLKTYSGMQFADRYFDARIHEVDPRVKASFESCVPYIWDLPQLTETSHHAGVLARTRALLIDLDASEARSGISLGLQINSNLHCMLSFASPNARRQSYTDNVVGQAITLGLAVYQLVADYVRRVENQSDAEQMSHIQRSILTCLANGMSDKQIAARVGTSTHNVDYHLRSLRQRHQVSNRTQLAYIAARLALI
jgi:DNA-binding CsgD family transcriptional regulator